MLLRDGFHHLASALRVVGTESKNLRVELAIVIQQVFQLSELIDACGSPISPVNHQYNVFLTPILRKLMDGSLLVNQTKIRSDLANLYSIYIGRWLAYAVKRTELWLLRLSDHCNSKQYRRNQE